MSTMSVAVEGRKSGAIVWSGRLVSAVVVVFLLADAGVGLFAPDLLRTSVQETGFNFAQVSRVSWIILPCVILYAIPQTAVLGAILISAFCGGAICAHFRLGELGSPPQIVSVLLAVLAWGGLYLRDARVRALLPARTIVRA